MQEGLQEGRLEVDGIEVVEVEPTEFDPGVSVGGAVGPGVVEDGRGGGGDGVDEGELVVVGFAEVEEILDYPEQVFDACVLAGLFQELAPEGVAGVFEELDPSAGQDPAFVLIRLREEHVPFVGAEAGDPVLEASVFAVEGDHGGHEFIRKPTKRI